MKLILWQYHLNISKDTKLKRKVIKKTVLMFILAGFMLITTGIWGWVHSFEHKQYNEKHEPIHVPDPENCPICYKLHFTIKSFETKIDSCVLSDLNFEFYVTQRIDQQINEAWSGSNFTRRGPPSA